MSKKNVRLLVLANSITYGQPLNAEIITNEDNQEAIEEAGDYCDDCDQHGLNSIILREEDVKGAIKGIEELSGKKLFTIDQICAKWEKVYGEKMKSEYRGFIKILRYGKL